MTALRRQVGGEGSTLGAHRHRAAGAAAADGGPGAAEDASQSAGAEGAFAKLAPRAVPWPPRLVSRICAAFLICPATCLRRAGCLPPPKSATCFSHIGCHLAIPDSKSWRQAPQPAMPPPPKAAGSAVGTFPPMSADAVQRYQAQFAQLDSDHDGWVQVLQCPAAGKPCVHSVHCR